MGVQVRGVASEQRAERLQLRAALCPHGRRRPPAHSADRPRSTRLHVVPLRQVQVQADRETGMCDGESGGLVRGGLAHHQAGAGHDPVLVPAEDADVDPRRQPRSSAFTIRCRAALISDIQPLGERDRIGEPVVALALGAPATEGAPSQDTGRPAAGARSRARGRRTARRPGRGVGGGQLRALRLGPVAADQRREIRQTRSGRGQLPVHRRHAHRRALPATSTLAALKSPWTTVRCSPAVLRRPVMALGQPVRKRVASVERPSTAAKSRARESQRRSSGVVAPAGAPVRRDAPPRARARRACRPATARLHPGRISPT